MNNKLLAAAEVAKMLSLSKNHVLELAKQGYLRYVTTNSGGYRFDGNQILEMLDNEKSRLKKYEREVIPLYDDGVAFFRCINTQFASNADKRLLYQIYHDAGCPYRIFGNYLRKAPPEMYADTLCEKSDIWVAETIVRMHELFDNKVTLGKKISIGILTIKISPIHSKKVYCLIYTMDNGGQYVFHGVRYKYYFRKEKGILFTSLDNIHKLYDGLEVIRIPEFMDTVMIDKFEIFNNYSECIFDRD